MISCFRIPSATILFSPPVSFFIQEEFLGFWIEGLSTVSIFEENFRSLNWILISLRFLALALTRLGLTDFTVAGKRKKPKGSRRTTPNKPLAFSLYPLTYLGTPTLPQTSLRDMNVHKIVETPIIQSLTIDTGICEGYKIWVDFWCMGPDRARF